MKLGMAYLSRRSERRIANITVAFISVIVLHQVFIRIWSNPDYEEARHQDLIENKLRKAADHAALDAAAQYNWDTLSKDKTMRRPVIGETLEQPLPKDDGGGGRAIVPPGLLRDALAAVATHSKLVIVPAVIDKGYLDLAVNFFKSSIQRLNLVRHTVFMCIHYDSCEEARNHGLPVYFYNNTVTDAVGDFNTKTFVQKAMLKHRIVRDIVETGYNTLMCDLDMHWFRSPVENILALCGPECDLAIQKEADIGLNSGFILAKATKATKDFYYALVTEIAATEKDDQTLYNEFVRKFSLSGELNIVKLPAEKYPDGRTYWTAGNRTLPPGPPCPQCLVVHNNWIVGTETKIFRFKEHGMWQVDNEGYYSDPDRKYITYHNPLNVKFWKEKGKPPYSEEYLALKAALGIAIATNRTLILPSDGFHVWEGRQTLQGVLLIRHFHNSFKSYYRESTFLNHKLVPESVNSKLCRGFRIENNFIKAHPEINNNPARIIFTPRDQENGCTSSEISRWLSAYDENCHVVEFESLYRAFKGFRDEKQNEAFEHNIRIGFEHAYYDHGRLLKVDAPEDPKSMLGVLR